MRKRLSLKSIEQLLWFNMILYFGMVSEDYGLDAPYDRFVANAGLFGISATVAGVLYLLRMRRERRAAAAGEGPFLTG